MILHLDSGALAFPWLVSEYLTCVYTLGTRILLATKILLAAMSLAFAPEVAYESGSLRQLQNHMQHHRKAIARCLPMVQ